MDDTRLYCFRALRSINLDHIKPGLQFCGMALHPKHSSFHDPLLLCGGHKLSCLSKRIGLPQFDLHKHKKLPVLNDQINFSETTPVIAVQDSISLSSKIGGRNRLAPGTVDITCNHKTSLKRTFDELDWDHTPSAPHNDAWYRNPYVRKNHTRDKVRPVVP